jgi:hypothetical protein
MPWTFAHPAAVVPLKRFAPRYLSLPALVCGSLTPDFGYYFNPYKFADNAHTLAGSFVICIPAGVFLLLLFQLFREPVWFLLPQTHRSVLAPLVARPTDYSPRALVIAIVSVLIGAWTHIVWDSFTHAGTWFYRAFPSMHRALFEIGSTPVYSRDLLQHGSTLIGIAVLASVYRGWLRKQPRPERSDETDRWRYLLIGGAIAASGITAMNHAWSATSHGVFKTVVDWTCLFAAVLFVYSLIYYSRRKVTTSTSR